MREEKKNAKEFTLFVTKILPNLPFRLMVKEDQGCTEYRIAIDEGEICYKSGNYNLVRIYEKNNYTAGKKMLDWLIDNQIIFYKRQKGFREPIDIDDTIR